MLGGVADEERLLLLVAQRRAGRRDEGLDNALDELVVLGPETEVGGRGLRAVPEQATATRNVRGHIGIDKVGKSLSVKR